MFLATFEVLSMHVFYNVLERAHPGELKTEQILSISQKLNEIIMVFLILNNTIANCEFPLEKNPQIQPIILFQQIQLC